MKRQVMKQVKDLTQGDRLITPHGVFTINFVTPSPNTKGFTLVDVDKVGWQEIRDDLFLPTTGRKVKVYNK